MAKTVVRRNCDPVVVQKIWNIVEYSRVNKQATTLDRITRAVMKDLSANEQEAGKHIDNALSDGLLERYSWTVAKGNRAGEAMEGVRIPEFKEPIDKTVEHDWYCFRCHKPGEVLECTECFRVWHPACLPPGSKAAAAAQEGGAFTCPTCVMNSKAEYKRKQIRKLLEFATHRLKGKPLWKDLGRIGYLDDKGRNDYLLFKYLDLAVISKKIKDGRYRSLESFLVDVNTLLHDVCVMYGDLSNMADLARVLLREIEVEIYEIRLCTNCYINAKARPSEWISKPCRPAHELVWAKLKGFPFWPAKVLEEKDTTYEVRFFGSYHERAAVTKESTRPYDIPPEELGVRRTPAFARALNEVQRLQKLVSEGYYTSSSGDSDMPPTDDEWTDEQYMAGQHAGLAGGASSALGGGGASGASFAAAKKRRPSSSAAAAAGAGGGAGDALVGGGGSGGGGGGPAAKKPSLALTPRKPPPPKKKKPLAPPATKKAKKLRGSDDEDDDDDSDGDEDSAVSDADSESSESRDEWRARVGLSGGSSAARKKPTQPPAAATAASAASTASSNTPTTKTTTATTSAGASSARKKPAPPPPPPPPSTTATAAASAAGAKRRPQPPPPATSAASAAGNRRSAAAAAKKSATSGGGASVGGVGSAIVGSPTAAAAAAGKQQSQQQQRQRKRSDLSSTDSSATSSPGSSCAVTSSIVEPRQQQQQQQQQHHPHHAAAVPAGGSRDHHHGAAAGGGASASGPAAAAAAAAATAAHQPLQPSPVKMAHKSVQAALLDPGAFEAAISAERQKLDDAVAAARKEAADLTKSELEKSEADLRAEFQRELESIMHQHREAIANTKRRQWCYNCLEEAMYHCCWNTSYCSIKCQQDHWHKEHKKVCRRKR